jgi:hypothetical protein
MNITIDGQVVSQEKLQEMMGNPKVKVVKISENTYVTKQLLQG